MMRRSREHKVFSMSAIDLFASAMGAFVIIVMMLFPYYLKTKQAQAASAAVSGELDSVRQKIEEARRREQAAMTANILEKILKRQLAAKTEIETTSKQVKALQEKIKKSVKFVFMGLQTDADSFTLLIDMSGSMRDYRALVFDTVDRIVNALTPPQKLSIIGFELTGAKPGFHFWPKPQNTLAVADAKNKREASRFVRQLSRQFAGSTPSYAALNTALQSPAEVIILLTDGIPSYPKNLRPGQIVRLVTNANGGKKEIHTVGLGEFNANPVFLDFLSKLAQDNGGDFISLAR